MFTQTDVGLGNQKGRIVAFLDFNGDLKIDLLIQDGQKLRIYQNYRNAFQNVLDINVTGNDYLCADFSGDGLVDILILQMSGKEVVGRLFVQGNQQLKEQRISFKSYFALPFIADVHGTLQPNLLGYSKDGKLHSWKYQQDKNDFVDDGVLIQSECSPIHPNSNAFVDLDGDCLADLFITCVKNSKTYFQVWINEKGKFNLKSEIALPEGAGHVTFGDIDADGSIDIVFPTCISNNCKLHVLYNHQMPFCNQVVTKDCRNHHKLCEADSNFKFDIDSLSSHVIIDFDRLLSGFQILITDPDLQDMPNPIRLGDYNNDGFPDLLVISHPKGSSGETVVKVLESIPCDSLCSNLATKVKRRSFKVVDIGSQSKDLKPIGAAFLDYNDDGSSDIFVFYKSTSWFSSDSSISLFQNNFENDAFFVTITILNDFCLENCPESSIKPYGVNYAGACSMIGIIDASGGPRVIESCQLPQQSYQSLLSAKTVIGIGRTNNYIENMFVGVSRHSKNHVAAYQGIIPNSAIVISPFENEKGDTSSWTLELFMNPSSTTLALIVIITTTLIMLAFIILGMDRVEKKEDAKERQSQLHTINYDAL